MTTTNSKPRDGSQVLADPVSRRIVAFGIVRLLAVPTFVSVGLGLVGGSAVAIAGAVGSFAIIAVVVAIQLLHRAELLAAQRNDAARLEHAAATASRALLKRDTTDPVGSALNALIAGVDADTVFLETNSEEDADEHGNVPTVRDVLHAVGPGGGPGHWELTGWKVSPEGQLALGSGESFSTAISALDAMTLAYYRANQIGSEVLFPITAEGRWVGSIGFTSQDRQREWTAGEQKLLSSVAESIGAYWERRDAMGQLEELLAEKDEFIASVSHEVRTPLTAVFGFAHELDEDIARFSEEERSEMIGLMAAQSREVANIVDDLLTAARADAGTIDIAPEVLSVRKLVGEVLSSHAGKVDFVMHNDVAVWADPGRVRQIIRNLLTNADRYGGDTVRILVHECPGQTRLEVRDNGKGIPPHLRDYVFEPYARAHHAATPSASAGLGLAVARKLAQLMGGELELLSEDGWTVFALTLPDAGSGQRPSEPAVLSRLAQPEPSEFPAAVR